MYENLLLLLFWLAKFVIIIVVDVGESERWIKHHIHRQQQKNNGWKSPPRNKDNEIIINNSINFCFLTWPNIVFYETGYKEFIILTRNQIESIWFCFFTVWLFWIVCLKITEQNKISLPCYWFEIWFVVKKKHRKPQNKKQINNNNSNRNNNLVSLR